MSILISPSMMCADLIELAKDITSLEKGGADYLHFDVMDGTFVPNYTLGTDLIKRIRKYTRIPFDIHLMVEHPEFKLGYFEFNEGDMVSVHYESTPHIMRVINQIKKMGLKACVALNPGSPICLLNDLIYEVDAVLIMTVNPGFAGQTLINSTISKIKQLKSILKEKGLEHVLIEVDGNVSFENAIVMKNAGADIFIAGSSSVFGYKEGIVPSTAIVRKNNVVMYRQNRYCMPKGTYEPGKRD